MASSRSKKAERQGQAEAKMMELYGFVVTSKIVFEELPDGGRIRQSLTLVDGIDTGYSVGYRMDDNWEGAVYRLSDGRFVEQPAPEGLDIMTHHLRLLEADGFIPRRRRASAGSRWRRQRGRRPCRCDPRAQGPQPKGGGKPPPVFMVWVGVHRRYFVVTRSHFATIASAFESEIRKLSCVSDNSFECMTKYCVSKS